MPGSKVIAHEKSEVYRKTNQPSGYDNCMGSILLPYIVYMPDPLYSTDGSTQSLFATRLGNMTETA